MPNERLLGAVVLAAGGGTRMKSKNPKVLFTVCGRPLVRYVLDAVATLSPRRIVIVIGHKGEDVRQEVDDAWNADKSFQGDLVYAWQREQKGTGHAVMCARDELGEVDDVLILNGDTTPLLTPRLLQDFVEFHRSEASDIALITYFPDNPASYGRVIRGPGGAVLRIVEARDLTPEQRDEREVNSGIYLVKKSVLLQVLGEITDQNAKREYYLTDIVQIGSGKGLKVAGMVAEDPSEVLGVNDRKELAEVESQKRRQILDALMLAGVTVRDPASTYVDYGVQVGQDTVLEPYTYLSGSTEIGSGCIIGPGTEIRSSVVGDGSRVWSSVVEDSDIGRNVQIGPYAHLRPNTRLSDDVLIGNFAEVKNSVIGPRTKIHHHSYTGDTDMGAGVNIGAGTVTVNYDGVRKYRTIIEDGAFIGCNTNLIAPVRVGKGAYVAAGSTINLEVPPESLAIARERQVNKEGWVVRRKEQGR
ncbi:MAG: bifunctional UDP-N-acetylglucosamine diphosphorylase/glucosamine-1-phosphate N-acetyltransferase GlmU [Bacillota bacterium]